MLFLAVSLTKHTDIGQYKYSGYGIGFSRRDEFSFGNEYGKNVIVFGVDANNSIHATNKTQNILIHGRDLTQGLAGTTVYVENCIQLILLKLIQNLF